MFKKHLNISKHDVNVTVKVHRKNQIKPLYLKGIVNAVVNSVSPRRDIQQAVAKYQL